MIHTKFNILEHDKTHVTDWLLNKSDTGETNINHGERSEARIFFSLIGQLKCSNRLSNQH